MLPFWEQDPRDGPIPPGNDVAYMGTRPWDCPIPLSLSLSLSLSPSPSLSVYDVCVCARACAYVNEFLIHFFVRSSLEIVAVNFLLLTGGGWRPRIPGNFEAGLAQKKARKSE